MGSQTILVLLVTLSAAHNVLGQVWDFGKDNTDSVVITHSEGGISELEKLKVVHLSAPQCYSIDYVRVEVHNLVSNPSVSFNKYTNVVSISYKPEQLSASTYDVVAKGKRLGGCFEKTLRSGAGVQYRQDDYE